MQYIKDLVEITKNIVTTLAIFVAGFWALYQWNTLFPTTEAKIEREIAAIRARTTGDVSVLLQAPPGGEDAYTEDGQSYTDICEAGNSPSLVLPLRINLDLNSSSDLAVRVTVQELEIGEIIGGMALLSNETNGSIFSPNAVHTIESIELTDASFVEGLRWSHVEPGGNARIVVLGTARLPIDCKRSEHPLSLQEFYFSLKTSIEPVLDRQVRPEEIATRYFVQSCLVQPAGFSSCNSLAENEGHPEGSAGSSTGLRTIGQ